MAEITFKNVGQGDSLILEWKDGAINKVAIIDTKKTKKTNPVIDHLRDKQYKYIDFILLSHPHEDHYSGMRELLDYVAESDIKVGWFGHTIDKSLNKDYWKLFEYTLQATDELDKLLMRAIELKRQKVINTIELVGKNWNINLSTTISLRACSPSHDEIELYQQKVKLEAKVNKREASQAANLLSTVLVLSSQENNILITSDAECISLERIYDQFNLKDLNLSVIQVPHHGSKKNYSDHFWNNLLTQRIAVISAGYNLKYKHPDIEVLNGLDGLKYKIHSTNFCHGMKVYIEAKRKSSMLDMITEIDETLFNEGDKSFSI